MRIRRYETVFILPSDQEDSRTQEILERLDSVLERSGGLLIKREDWGVRKLAYLINRHTKGRYFLLDFVGSPQIVAELERHFKMIESVLRFLTVKQADEVDMESVKLEQKEEQEKEEARKASAREQAEAEAARKAAEEAAKAEAKAAEAEAKTAQEDVDGQKTDEAGEESPEKSSDEQE